MVIISIFFNSISRSNRSLLSDLHPWTTDVLDDFSAPATTSQPKAAVPPTTVSEEAEEDNLDAVLDDDFAKQLAAGMEELMAGEDQEEFKETFEKIWKSFESTSLEDPNPSSNPVDPETKRSFQDTIAQTMNKLRDSSDKVEVSMKVDGTSTRIESNEVLLSANQRRILPKSQKMLLCRKWCDRWSPWQITVISRICLRAWWVNSWVKTCYMSPWRTLLAK